MFGSSCLHDAPTRVTSAARATTTNSPRRERELRRERALDRGGGCGAGLRAHGDCLRCGADEIRGGRHHLASGAALPTDIGTSRRRPEGKSSAAAGRLGRCAQPALLPVVGATPGLLEPLTEPGRHDHEPSVGLELVAGDLDLLGLPGVAVPDDPVGALVGELEELELALAGHGPDPGPVGRRGRAHLDLGPPRQRVLHREAHRVRRAQREAGDHQHDREQQADQHRGHDIGPAGPGLRAGQREQVVHGSPPARRSRSGPP